MERKHELLIEYIPIPFKSKEILLPYIRIVRGKGIHVLLTAGSDGDEHDGIEAAQRLANLWHEDQRWSGTRTIFPLLNPLGHAASVSWNPVDNLLPKTIFPGKADGSLSEQMINAFWNTVDSSPDLWLDLHGGSQVEYLDPFVWGFPAGSKLLQEKTKYLLRAVPTKRKVFAPWHKVAKIAKLGCLYMVLESGQLGQHSQESVDRHIAWVTGLIDVYQQPMKHSHDQDIFYRVQYHFSPRMGYWSPNIESSQVLLKDNSLGVLHDHATNLTLHAKQAGEVLWYHAGGWVKPGETLIAVGENFKA